MSKKKKTCEYGCCIIVCHKIIAVVHSLTTIKLFIVQICHNSLILLTIAIWLAFNFSVLYIRVQQIFLDILPFALEQQFKFL
jgi:hypothetical protein